MIRSVLCLLVSVASIAACGGDQTTDGGSSTTPHPVTETSGVGCEIGSTGQLTCPTDQYEISTGESRTDWHDLTPDDMTKSPVAFSNDLGWIWLELRMVRLNDTWLVGGYESCAPGG